MPIPYNQTVFDTHKCVSAWIEYPFRDVGDSTTKIYHHKMQGNLSSYSPLSDDNELTDAGNKPEGSPFSDDSSAFYVGDSATRDVGGGVVEYERVFANVPQDRTDSNGIYAFNLFHGTKKYWYQVDTSPSPAFTITGGTGTWGCTFTLNSTHESYFSVGDFFFINYGISSGTHFLTTSLDGSTADNERFLEWEITTKTSAGGGSYDFVASLRYPDGFTSLAKGTSVEWDFEIVYQPSRTSETVVNSPSFINYRYVKTSDPSTIALKQKFIVKNVDGQQVNEITATTTSPSQDAYLGIVNSGSIIAAEDEYVNPDPWKGNIYEVAQIMVKSV